MSIDPDSARLQVGRIDKAHGIRGEVLVSLITNRTERVDPGAILFSGERRFVVGESRPHQHRWAVLFDGIATRNQAEELRGLDLVADPIDDPDELWVHDLLDAPVIDTAGTHLGTVMSVEANPASDLLLLDNDALVPLTFLVEIDADGSVVVDPPAGLFELDGSND